MESKSVLTKLHETKNNVLTLRCCPNYSLHKWSNARMKSLIRFFLAVLALSSFPSLNAYQGEYSVELHPIWQDLESHSKRKHQFEGKWILVGSITFTKKAKDSIRLNKICLKWHGPHLECMTGSLYKRKSDRPFLPIEEYLIADSLWSTFHQTIMFTFNNRQTLGAINEFYLVLTVPSELEQTLQNGHFSIEKKCLPGPFQACNCTNQLVCGTLVKEQKS